MSHPSTTPSAAPSGSSKGRYIIRAGNDRQPLLDFLGASGNDPAIEVVDSIGPPGLPHTVVAEMPHDTARAMQQRFQHSELIIEPDRPLSLFPS